jgi:protein-glutamine gamma-glutamyltransferase
MPAPRARLVAFVLLAGVAALQWVRYVDGETALRPLLWVLAGTVTGVALIRVSELPRRWVVPAAVAVALGGLALAVALSGLELRLLLPRHWDELGNGLTDGAQSLNTVALPYVGKDPWVLATVQLLGAGLCWAAAVATTWPSTRGGPRLLGLVLLLVLAASPVVSIGTLHPVALGMTLAVLTAAFLWADRVPRRPGLGLAVLAGITLLVAIPLGGAADREEPWFDYKAFSENFAGGRPITFDWNHGYGPINWPREGAEVFRVRAPGPLYWKADTLSSFDGREWVQGNGGDRSGDDPVDDLPGNWSRHPKWTTRLTFSLKRLQTPTVVGAGTILDVRDSTRRVMPDAIPGRWVPQTSDDLSSGDSYSVDAHVPRPTPAQLAAATVGKDPRRRGDLDLHIDFRPDALNRSPLTPPVPGRPRRPIEEADLTFRPFEDNAPPTAHYRILGTDGDGSDALDRSFYDRTWTLAQDLRRRATSPYDYVLRVNNHLRDSRFRYTEVPPPSGKEAPLESFLFDTRLGYCQQFSGAMVLLLRMGGIPARVATGFSPGGFRRSTGEWIVRDTDAHSWVEAWFDGIGWVTFDPTPPQTPARSQIAAIDPPKRDAAPPATSDRSGTRPLGRRPGGLQRDPTPEPAAAVQDGGFPWVPVVLGAVLLTAVLAVLVQQRRRRAALAGLGTGELALLELERALRRSGRAAPEGTTLRQLERRLGVSAEGSAYLRALRSARYGSATELPTGAQRAAFRRELASGLGWRGRLRAMWALPPVPPRPRPRARRGRPGGA